jgi:hypothetical protein
MALSLKMRRSLANFGEMILRGFSVAIGQHETGTFALLRADRAEDIGPHRALIQRG